MDKAVEITVKRQSGTFPLVVVVGEDGKFYKIQRTHFSDERQTFIAGILRDDKIALGIRYYSGDLTRNDGQELYFGKIGGACEALMYLEQYTYDQDAKIEVKEISEYQPNEGDITSFDAADLFERQHLEHIMCAAKRSFGHII